MSSNSKNDKITMITNTTKKESSTVFAIVYILAIVAMY